MCAILGFLDKTGDTTASIGRILLRMLLAVGCRGPDSAGVAVFGGGSGGLVLQVKLGEQGDPTLAAALTQRLATLTEVREHSVTEAYLRLVLDDQADPARVVEAVESYTPDQVEVVSMGHRLEILKQVGSPQELEATYRISRLRGTHAIAHTRLSTESRVDLSHSQPFWAHGLPDVATAHNGHITNYHQMRRRYEQRGIR